MSRPSAADLIRLLDLQPLAPEGGYYRETHRAASTAIYYLLTPDTVSALHRLQKDEVFHFYLGDPVEQLVLRPDGSGEVRVLGSNPAAGMFPQAVVPRGCWQGARLRAGGKFALMGTTVAPPFGAADYEPGDRERLQETYPAFAGVIRTL